MREEVAAAGETAMQDAMNQIRQPRINSQDVIMYDPNAEVTKGNQYESGGWLHAPAHFELFANTDERLSRISAQLGAPVREVRRVRALRVKGTKLIYFWPTYDEDPNGIPVKRYDSSTWINFIKLLKPAGLAVETGHKERYHVYYAEPTDHVYPALKLDLSLMQERQREEHKSKSKSQQTDKPAAEEDAQTHAKADQRQTVTAEAVVASAPQPAQEAQPAPPAEPDERDG